MEALFKALIWIQQNLQAPKSEYNSFGKFNYRSLESILAALKPLLAQQHCGIRFADDVVEHGGRTFVRSTLYFFNDKGESISTTAEAEHSATKTGMDSAQITGAASSYARKYCLNGLFAIDDTKDPDSNAYMQQTQEPVKKTPTRRTRTSSTTSAQATTPAAKDPRYQYIQAALAAVKDIDGLIDLYEQHKMEVEGNAEIKAMFSRRKQELRVITF
jgi:hypothetical protein